MFAAYLVGACGSTVQEPPAAPPYEVAGASSDGTEATVTGSAGSTVAAPPAGCSADRPCSPPAPCIPSFQDRMNCGPVGCREGALRCATDADCQPAWRCNVAEGGAGGQCVVRECRQDGDCNDPNHACAAGHCAPRPCQRDADCPGHCLSTQDPAQGQCWPTPGVCSTWMPRPSPPPAP